MKEILINCLLKEPFEQYKKYGKAKTGHGGKIEVPYSFYEDLMNNDLYNNYHEKRKIHKIKVIVYSMFSISSFSLYFLAN